MLNCLKMLGGKVPTAARNFAIEIATKRQCLQQSLEQKLKKYPIYLDYQATTPTDPRVLDAMLPYYLSRFGNAHSKSHKYGEDAEESVEKARAYIASLIGASTQEIVFTSGATESNNLAIKGVASFAHSEDPSRNHLITVQTEHKCVLETCRDLSTKGMEVTYLPVQRSGILDLAVLEQAIRPSTVLVSVMAVNNEIGVVQNLEEIGKICRKRGVHFHTDAAQALGKIPLNVDQMHIDLMSMSGHKVYGPKGVGALYIRRKPRVKLDSLIKGGGQERGLRSGTLAVPLLVGFGEACRIAQDEMESDWRHLQQLNLLLRDKFKEELPKIEFNGDLSHRYPGNLNVSFLGVEGEGLMVRTPSVAVSSGSACTSESLEPSYVLHALGLGDDQSHTSIRIGLGRFTTKEEVLHAADTIVGQVRDLREMSPIWEMMEEGVDLSKIKWDNE